nr:GATA transcription factor 12-like [Tanacetum cinerariifolium]
METLNFTVDDLLLDFPADDDVMLSDSFDFSTSNSSLSGNESQFSGSFGGVEESQFSGGHELCFPYDELAELEWLSRFTEESFSSDDLNNLRLISAGNITPVTDTSSSVTGVKKCYNRINSPIFQNDVLVPGKIRSKRSRAAPGDWSSRLIHLKSTVEVDECKTTSLGDRGPMGPKTLCNACGVRFKSGRLVPEYRPAASPTFVPAKHSNSHRKVMELRRQMELRDAQQRAVTHGSGYEGCNDGDEYLIHRQIGPNFMHMI